MKAKRVPPWEAKSWVARLLTLRLAASFVTAGFCAGQWSAIAASNPDPKASSVFVGTTPCGEGLKKLLQIPSKADALRWSLTLEKDPSQRPARYELRCRAVLSPGVNEKEVFTASREGKCTLTKGTKADPERVVIELENAFSVVQIGTNILHILDPERSLMVGTGGFSYTLNQIEAAEKPGDWALALSRSSVSYTNLPLADGPTVLGIFEGRTPCIGVARELAFPEDSGCVKVKWRITLFQNPETKTPTTYRVENSLYRGRAREGRWSITNGIRGNPNAVVYSLAASDAGPGLFLLKGDENVLFFLNQQREPMVGHADFSYTLNRTF